MSKKKTIRLIDESSLDNIADNLPNEPVSCGCTDHGDRKTMDITLPIPVQVAFAHFFGPSIEPSWWRKTHDSAGDHDFDVPDWDEKNEKNIKYIIKLNNPMLRFTETDCFEKHTLVQRKENM